MALGTITPVVCTPVGTSGPANYGDVKGTTTNVVGDGSYPTGGSAITAQQLGLTNVLTADVQIAAATGTNSGAVSATCLPQGDGSIKLKCFVTAGTSPVQVQEAANAANLSGITWQIQAQGY